MNRANLLISERQGGIDRGTLFIASEKLSDAELDTILPDLRVPALSELTLHHNALTAASARAIADSSKLAALKDLDLSNNPIGDEGLTALASSRTIAGLQRLSLAAIGATGDGVRAFAASPQSAGVAELDLGFQNIGVAAASLLSPRAKLSLQKANIDGPTAVTLLRTAQVHTLNLKENSLGLLTGLDGIAPTIVGLDLTACMLTDVSSLTRANAPGLRTLNIDYNPIGDAGLAVLAQARWLGQLQFLSVMGAKSSAEGRQVLRSAWGKRPGLTIEQ